MNIKDNFEFLQEYLNERLENCLSKDTKLKLEDAILFLDKVDNLFDGFTIKFEEEIDLEDYI